jgi:hypothetical protein
MKEDIITKVKAIRRTAEILMEHEEARLFRNTVMDVGLKNIVGISQNVIDDLEKEKAPEPHRE